jgi:hypothetical protein
LPTSHQLSPRIRMRPSLNANALRSSGRIALLSREQGPGDPRRLIDERDNCSIEASPRGEPLQPLGTAIVMLRQSKHDCAGAVDHLPPKIMIGAPANAAEAGFAAGRVLTRHKANPCRELPPRAKMAAVVNRGDERCCDHRPDAWQLRERRQASFVRQMATNCRSSLSSRRSRLTSSSSMSLKSARARSDNSASAMASRACASNRHAPCGKIAPYSPRSPRIWLIRAVRHRRCDHARDESIEDPAVRSI